MAQPSSEPDLAHSGVPCMVPDPFQRGKDLHQRVPPERWCITRKDLDLFDRDVRVAWKAGTIPNSTESPNPSHDDPDIGPTMYQVTEHYIKPLTAKHGGVSYALMLHPEGLLCDAFATHTWAEGVFEFIGKLRRGWPHDCNSMYVCFLANPQNLNISELLNVPIEESPFAKALESAKTMLVIPNQFVSIYTRLWCGYEAYLAHKLNKTIILPPALYFVVWVQRLSKYMVANFLIGLVLRIAICMIAPPMKTPEVLGNVLVVFAREIAMCCWAGALACYPKLSTFRQMHACYIGAAVLQAGASGVLVGRLVLLFHELEAEWDAYFFFFFVCILSVAPSGLAFCIALRSRAEQASNEEASQLSFPEGGLASARCSNTIDKQRILAAITGKEVEVEATLRRLFRHGISTIEMRRASLSWVGGSGAQGYVKYDLIFPIVTAWSLVLSMTLSLDYTRSWKLFFVYEIPHRRAKLAMLNSFAGFVIASVWASCSAQELSSLVIYVTFRGSMITVVAGLLGLMFGGHHLKDRRFLLLFFLLIANSVLGTATIAFGRYRHIRWTELLSYSERALVITSMWCLVSLSWIIWEDMLVSLASLVALGLVFIVAIGVGGRNVIPCISAVAFLLQAVISIICVWDLAWRFVSWPPLLVAFVMQIMFAIGLVAYTLFAEFRHYRHKQSVRTPRISAAIRCNWLLNKQRSSSRASEHVEMALPATFQTAADEDTSESFFDVEIPAKEDVPEDLLLVRGPTVRASI